MPEQEPHRDEQGRLTRAGMEAVIASGGTVSWQGRQLSRLEDLPTGADLAQGDAAREQQERDRLFAQRQAIDNELAKLGSASAQSRERSLAEPSEQEVASKQAAAQKPQQSEPKPQEGPAPTSFRGPTGPTANPGTPAASTGAAATPAGRAQNPKEEKR